MTSCTLSQLKLGLTKYAEAELVGKVSGLRKWALALMISPLISNIDTMVDSYRSLLVSSGYLTEDGTVNIDKLYTTLKEEAHKGSVIEHLPLLGDVTFSEDDIDKLYRYTV